MIGDGKQKVNSRNVHVHLLLRNSVCVCFVGYVFVKLFIGLVIMSVWKLFMTSNTVLKLFKKVPPQALLVRVKYKLLLNQNVVSGLCTQQDFCVSFDNPAVQKYIANLRLEFKTLKAEGDCCEGHKKRRLLEILPIINIIDERNALNENIASLKELTSGQNIVYV